MKQTGQVVVAATQMRCTWDLKENLQKAQDMVTQAAAAGANIILLQELFETPYFCHQERYRFFDLATPASKSPAIAKLAFLAKKLGVVLPVSFFERAGNSFFNSLVVIDADGRVLETYRKTHIPTGANYEEKFYFVPGDTGFKVWQTRFGKIGVGICWDQWFPETARILTLLGAEIIFYPTAIGSEPVLTRDTEPHWQRTIQGHAAANIVPIVVSNRVGTEKDDNEMTFYGSSFIADQFGALLQQADRQSETYLCATLDLEQAKRDRQTWGIFRDRRPEMYQQLMTTTATNE
ncbi:N-carbamoylputrescine amidase [Loigolactobacillus bifermentans]|jgi:N-carbamoylputrescine amidase|uniref:N-carbamoylputrescine amidase n=1 Tax=Loigolactobacillus bifermentans DSM 20003 TaxID=1423726 RepID=A0A0R1HBG8_9LACO|nr:N-carbamoylputrescine amidase [Loigolactobacillus bifermentans]KRK41018.1 N-carbamoylputrescine amidase [Loigolactobacillus bifermentans DSM 20003]QGG59898.1 N-carbamoylputrescine amidase [Loigolactobacillus bifermentans]